MVAKATTQGAPEPRIVLSNIEWETYERLLADQADSSAPRFAYDRGALEIMSPLPEHERYNRTLAALVESVAEELGLDVENLGSTTFKREDLERGFEPDSCFYIQHEAAMRGKNALDLRVDPPPDLVIAIDITHPSLDKFPIYAALGVPEVWRYDGRRLELWALEDAHYVERAESNALPGVAIGAVLHLVERSKRIGRVAWLREVRAWARQLAQGQGA